MFNLKLKLNSSNEDVVFLNVVSLSFDGGSLYIFFDYHDMDNVISFPFSHVEDFIFLSKGE